MRPPDDRLPEEREEQYQDLIGLLQRADPASVAVPPSKRAEIIEWAQERLMSMDEVSLDQERPTTQMGAEASSPPMHETSAGAIRHHGRFTRFASFLAAVLIVGVLVVTSALLFNRDRKGNEPQPGTSPISITLSNCASQPMPVLVNLCTHHQLKNLLQRRTIGNDVLVLERAYLDMNQLVITYRVFSQSTGRQTLAYLTWANTDTVITTSQGQSFTPSGGENPAAGPQAVQFSTPPMPVQTRTLQFHVEVNTLHIESLPHLPPAGTPLSESQPTAVHGPVTFDFTLDYQGGLVVTPHQTFTVKAISVTLERVKISPSETIIEGTTKGTLPDTSNYTFSLDAAGRSSSPASSEFGSNFSIVFYDGLIGQHGTWTFQISDANLEGPWVFHFTVP